MSEMIERVAKALANAERDWDAAAKTDPAFPQSVDPRLMFAARAAIEAMREPTPAMVDAGWAGTWRSMIENALSR